MCNDHLKLQKLWRSDLWPVLTLTIIAASLRSHDQNLAAWQLACIYRSCKVPEPHACHLKPFKVLSKFNGGNQIHLMQKRLQNQDDSHNDYTVAVSRGLPVQGLSRKERNPGLASYCCVWGLHGDFILRYWIQPSKEWMLTFHMAEI